MCEPTMLAAAAIGTGAMQAYSQYTSGKFNADVANQNAKLSDAAADDAVNRGNADAEKQRTRARQLAGTQAATMSANGVDLGAGGALDIFGDTAAMGELDALTVMNNASREAYGHKLQAANDRLNAKMSRRQGNIGAIGTILTTPLSAWGAYKVAGGTGNPLSFGSESTTTGSNLFDTTRQSGNYGRFF
ncbi:hypothetical protein [Morganella psychrotolerans]|uniref:Phage protein n=1 Tax=Morganella psychrotolerans TaxID=368603 RepID=A0A1B8H701_9GAMM|nr:hypothetical protein [Morganella psychrotolerans]OBU04840.1 hypothetical protein AYY17_08065 [Morganella psychrotolerans]